MKKIILLGLAIGVVIVTSLSSFLFYLYQDEKKNLSLNVEKSTLLELSKHLELYKSKYQKYPDSLQKLLKSIPPEMQNEYISTLNMLVNVSKKLSSDHLRETYYYKIVDQNHYYLFALGKDKQPFTDDDIYIEKNDYGLINPR